VDVIVTRTFYHRQAQLLAEYATVPVINGLSDEEHPCQALADLLTIYEKKGGLKGVTIAYVGDANNVAHSLLLGASMVGANFQIASPPGYQLKEEILKQAQSFAAQSGAAIMCTEKPQAAVRGADIVYTDVWTSMGQEAEVERRRADFAGYQVTAQLLALAGEGALFMHPLPAHHGEEVAHGLIDCPQSIVFDQAENRLHAQKALLVDLLRDARNEAAH
jgi:ornithine carbamoyltransferase